MKFKKIMPYKIKRLIPMLGLAGAAMVMPGCEKTPIQQHDTVYMWGVLNWDNIWPPQNIYASADSVQVKNVILKLDKNDNDFEHLDDEFLYKNMIAIWAGLSPEKQEKLSLDGTAKNLIVSTKGEHVYIDWLSERGLQFENLRYRFPDNNNTKTIGWNKALETYNQKSR